MKILVQGARWNVLGSGARLVLAIDGKLKVPGIGRQVSTEPSRIQAQGNNFKTEAL